jgi:hypothetical protein
MNLDMLDTAEMSQKAIDPWFLTLGMVNTLRFINQIFPGSGNCIIERVQWLEDLSLDQIVKEIIANRTEKP